MQRAGWMSKVCEEGYSVILTLLNWKGKVMIQECNKEEKLRVSAAGEKSLKTRPGVVVMKRRRERKMLQ